MVWWLYSAILITLTGAERPNFVMIMADDMGWNDIGRHGSEILTPYIDGLMTNGVELHNYYASPNCGPSRAQFLSGKYITRLGLQHRNLLPCRPMALPVNERTIADYLREFGYKSHVTGKWHAGFYNESHLPTNRGFDSFRGMLLGQTSHYHHTKPYNQNSYLDWHDNTEPYRLDEGVYSTFAIEERAKEIITEHGQSGDPMFLWVSYAAPHVPLQAPQGYKDLYRHIQNKQRRDYAAMVTAMDHSIGRIIHRLQSTGMYNNTLIAFVSDNGGQAKDGASNYPYRGNKGSYYEGGVKVLGAMSGGIVKRRGIVTDLFHITDWLPTFVRLARDGAVRQAMSATPTTTTMETMPETPLQTTERSATVVEDRDTLSNVAAHVAFFDQTSASNISISVEQITSPSRVPTTSNSTISSSSTTSSLFSPSSSTNPSSSAISMTTMSTRNLSTTIIATTSMTTPRIPEVDLSDIDGVDQWDTISLIQPTKRFEVLFNIDPRHMKGIRSSRLFDTRQLASLRIGRWKLLTGEQSLSEIIPNPVSHLKAWDKFPRGRDRKEVQLYDLEGDPTESFNLAVIRTDVVDIMLRRLAEHAADAIPASYPPSTTRCNPRRRGGVWGPYHKLIE